MGTFSNDNTQQKKKKSSAIHLDSVSTRYSGNIADVLEKARSSNITLGEEARSENVKIGDADGTKKKGSSSRKNAKPKSNPSSNKNAPSFKRTLNNEIRHKNNEIQIIKSQIETIEKTSGSYGELQKLNQKLEKAEKEVQNLYEMREKLTPHFDKQDHVKELKQQLEHVRQLADETSKKLDQIRESDNPDLKEYTRLFDLERKQLDKVERLSERFERTQARPESFVSATRRISSKAQDKIRNPVQKIIKNTRLYKTMNKIRSPFSKGVNKVRTTMQKGVRKAGGTVVDIFKRLIKFLFTTHIGRIITVVWLIFSIMISEVINTPPQTAEMLEAEKPTVSVIENQAMNYALRDIDMKFYKQYHASVSPVNLSPVFTAFIDEFRVAELVNKNEKELNEEDFETMAKYLSKLYRMAYEEYFEEINVDSYVIRELFLDEVKYSYYYLYREWTEWENTKKPEPAQQYVSLGQSVSSVMNELEDSLNEASLEEAMERDEFLEDGNYYISVSYIEEYEVTKTREVEDTCTRKVKVNPFCVGDKCAMKEEEYDCSYTQTYKEVETRTGSRTITVKKYSVRDVVEGSEKWITDRSKAEKDCDRESIQHSKINDFALDYHPESATYKLKDGREKTIPWEERTIDRMDQNDGVIVRSNRRWTVRKFEDVVHDIVWEWNPTVHNEFAGDTLHLYKYDTGPKNTLDKDFPIEIDVEIDKRSLYREYYVAKDNYTESYQRPESFFTERDCNLTEEYIKMLKDVFIQLMSGVYGAIDGGPDFEGCPDAWLNPPEGMNPFPYGQCTWFAFGMWYQTYHEVLEGIDAAHYGGGNGKNVVDNLIAARAEFGDFEYADYASGGMPVPGSLISFSYADGIYAEYGHVAFVTEVGEDGSITVIEGNIEGRLEAYDYEDAISSSIGITTYSSIDELCTRRNYDYVHFANPVESPQS